MVTIANKNNWNDSRCYYGDRNNYVRNDLETNTRDLQHA